VNSFIIFLPSSPDILQYTCHRILGCDTMQSAKGPPAASYTQIIVRQKHYDLNQFAWCFVAFKFLRMFVVHKMHVRKNMFLLIF